MCQQRDRAREPEHGQRREIADRFSNAARNAARRSDRDATQPKNSSNAAAIADARCTQDSTRATAALSR